MNKIDALECLGRLYSDVVALVKYHDYIHLCKPDGYGDFESAQFLRQLEPDCRKWTKRIFESSEDESTRNNLISEISYLMKCKIFAGKMLGDRTPSISEPTFDATEEWIHETPPSSPRMVSHAPSLDSRAESTLFSFKTTELTEIEAEISNTMEDLSRLKAYQDWVREEWLHSSEDDYLCAVWMHIFEPESSRWRSWTLAYLQDENKTKDFPQVYFYKMQGPLFHAYTVGYDCNDEWCNKDRVLDQDDDDEE